MPIRFDNYAKKVGTRRQRDREYGWFRWRIYVAEDAPVLDGIEYVDYVLHPSFVDPSRRVADRASAFALEAEGWGGFKIYGTVHLRDGRDEDFEHYLDLGKGWP